VANTVSTLKGQNVTELKHEMRQDERMVMVIKRLHRVYSFI